MLSSPEMKRQLLIQSDKSGIKERLLKKPPSPDGLSEDEIIEMGNALEAVTKMKGWNYLESFMLREIDFVGIFYGETTNESKIGQGRAMIKARDELLKRRQDELDRGKTTRNPKEKNDGR
jgi:hypothetical protein